MTHDNRKLVPAGAAREGERSGRRVPRVLKLYDEVRTAHLERITEPRTTILFRRHRYDFDEALARGIDLQQAGAGGTLLWALRNPVDAIEVSEPFVVGTATRSLAAIIGNRARSLMRRERRARIVSYGIESLHPADAAPHLPIKARIRDGALALLVPMVWRGIDRFALGTDLAQEVYRRSFTGRWPEHRVIPALPVARAGVDVAQTRASTMVFLGDFSQRKGFPDLLAAWPQIKERVPEARLTIIGKGIGEPDALALAQSDPSVRVIVSPPREEIFTALAESRVVVLPSRRTPLWREQVGLPIVEGLSCGCAVVATSETGLAHWLGEHQHWVVPPGNLAALCAAAVAALESERGPAEIIADLPAIDGRAAAEAWLFEGID